MGHDVKKSFTPEIVVMYCNGAVAEDASLPARVETNEYKARLVMMPCGSKVETYQLLDILAGGADGIQVIACPEKKCRFLVGNERARKRVEWARKILADIDMGPKRVGLSRGEKLLLDDVKSIAHKRADEVWTLGSNPMKGDK